jgi:hypothetical protein
MKAGRAGTFTHDYKRHGTTVLFAALNALRGTVTSMCQPRSTATRSVTVPAPATAQDAQALAVARDRGWQSIRAS